MADEPAKMNVGGRVPGYNLTADEYQRNLVDYYDFGGIEVANAPPADPTDPDPDPDPGPQIIPASYADSPSENDIFSQLPSLPVYGSDYKPNSSVYFSTQDYSDYIKDYDLTYAKDKSGNGEFMDVLTEDKAAQKQALGVTTALPPQMMPAVALGYVASSITKKIHRNNAADIAATGGKSGSMYKFRGQVLSRAPGSKITNGNLMGMDQTTALRADEIRKGFIPGTMTFKDGNDGDGFSAVVKTDGGAMDPFGHYHGAQLAETGAQIFTGGRLREVEFREAAEALGIDVNAMTKQQFRDAALAHKQFVDAEMRGSTFYGGFFHKTSRMGRESYNAALELRQKTSANYLRDKYGLGESTVTTGSGTTTSTLSDAQQQAEDYDTTVGTPPSDDGSSGFDYSDPANYIDDSAGFDYSGFFNSPSPEPESRVTTESFAGRGEYDFVDEEGGARYGGRIGMQMGGAAPQAAPAGFVERPPSQVSEAATVADDKPMSVPEGTFVINAAAVEIAGEADIAEMLNKAYENYRVRGGKEVMGRTPSKEEVDVAVSRGEVIVPPHIAKIIGYDRLKKINNRGKKETKQRIKENGQGRRGAAGGGFLAEKKFANGGEIYEDRIIMMEVRRKMDELLKNLPDDVKVTSEYYGDDYPATEEFYKEFARLNDVDPDQAIFTLRPFSAGEELINAPQTPTLINLYALAEEIAHLESNKYAIPEPTTSQIIRADRRTGFDQEPGSDAFMRKQYGQYEEGGYETLEEFSPEDIEGYKAVFGYDPTTKRNVFDYPEYYAMERQYAEEMRAKKFAFDVVFGSMKKEGIKDTKLGKTIQFTEDTYGTEFARYILETASPTIQKGIFAKYPELRERYFDDKGRFINRKIMPDEDFRMAMSAENAIMAERTQKEFEASPDNRGYLDKFLGIPRKSTYIKGYGRVEFDDPRAPESMQTGGKVSTTRPTPSPVRQQKAARQEAERFADLELRADLEEFIRDDQLARLGWSLYTSGELKVVGIPTPFDYTRVTKGEGEDARETVKDEEAYGFGGVHYPIPRRDTKPMFGFGDRRQRYRSSDEPNRIIRRHMDRVGIKPSSEIPMAAYFAEGMYIPRKGRTDQEIYMSDKSSVMLTLAHELRHAAINHLVYEYGAPEMTGGKEERLMDYFDQTNRKQASKNNKLVSPVPPYKAVAERGESAVNLTMYKKEAKLYNELASEVLKLRGVPLRAKPEEKGWLQKTIDTLFN